MDLRTKFDRRILLALVVATACMTCGCDQAHTKTADNSVLQTLASLHARYQARNQGKFPPDEAALREFISTNHSDGLERLGVTLDELFVSNRDGQPFVVLYGKEGAKQSGESRVIAYEQTGDGGTRYVAFAEGRAEELPEAEFQKLVSTS